MSLTVDAWGAIACICFAARWSVLLNSWRFCGAKHGRSIVVDPIPHGRWRVPLGSKGDGSRSNRALARFDPLVDRPPVVLPEGPRQLDLRKGPVQKVLRQHSSLGSVRPRTASRFVGSANLTAVGRQGAPPSKPTCHVPTPGPRDVHLS